MNDQQWCYGQTTSEHCYEASHVSPTFDVNKYVNMGSNLWTMIINKNYINAITLGIIFMNKICWRVECCGCWRYESWQGEELDYPQPCYYIECIPF